MSKRYHQRPSQLLNLTNDYEAFCFDEACAYIMGKLEEKEQPKFKIDYSSSNSYNNDDIINFFNENNNKLV
jgi:hypothetical protein